MYQIVNFSVIICTYNTKNYIKRAIESVYNQTNRNFELIIIDDGSTDNTKEFIETLNPDLNILYFYQKNQGLPAARNKGIELSSGKYIVLLDADDELMPYALEEFSNKLEETNVKWIMHNVIRVENNQRSISCSYKLTKDFLYSFLKGFGSIFATCFEKKMLIEIGLYDTQQIYYEDRDLWIRLLQNNISFSYINKTLYIYHIRKDSITKSDNYKKKLYFLNRLFAKHYKLIAKRSNKIRILYSYRMWRLASDYFHKTGDLGKTFKCLSESIMYNPKILFQFLKKSIFLILKHNQSQK